MNCNYLSFMHTSFQGVNIAAWLHWGCKAMNPQYHAQICFVHKAVCSQVLGLVLKAHEHRAMYKGPSACMSDTHSVSCESPRPRSYYHAHRKYLMWESYAPKVSPCTREVSHVTVVCPKSVTIHTGRRWRWTGTGWTPGCSVWMAWMTSWGLICSTSAAACNHLRSHTTGQRNSQAWVILCQVMSCHVMSSRKCKSALACTFVLELTACLYLAYTSRVCSTPHGWTAHVSSWSRTDKVAPECNIGCFVTVLIMHTVNLCTTHCHVLWCLAWQWPRDHIGDTSQSE